jgi:hypothetical protein
MRIVGLFVALLRVIQIEAEFGSNCGQVKNREFPEGDIPMKNPTSLAGLLLILSLVPLTFAQPPAVTASSATGSVTLSGAAFICANQVATGNCPDAEFDPALGSIQNPQGTWVANVVLPPGVTVTALKLCGNFNEVGSSIKATLDSTPLTSSSGFPEAVAMASVQSSGAVDKTQCFGTTAITNPTISNAKNQYFVVVVVPDNDGVIFTAVQIDY